MTLSEKIIFVRSELLLTQVQLAKELGVFQVTTSRWESNKKIPQLIQESKFNKFCEKNNIKFEEYCINTLERQYLI